MGSLLLPASILCALPLLSGCMPYPHRTVRSLEVRGTVLDARTHVPIKGAKVVQSGTFPREQRRETTTDAFGRFVLPTSHNFHWAVSADGDVPQRRYYEALRIFYPDYLAYEVQGLGGWDLNVLLQPAQSLEVAGRVVDSRTKAPVGGAKVCFLYYPKLSATSDSGGRFRLKAAPDLYQAYLASRDRAPFTDWVSVSHSGYRAGQGFHCGEQGEILLRPLP
jgi:hypothetical protein